jgi:glycosyltransferase involved in cell wall biosynthesis
MRVSIVIPAYNEEKRISKTLDRYIKFFDRKPNLNYKIFVVINNTNDKTEEIVKNFTNPNKNLTYVSLEKGGKGNALIYGFNSQIKDSWAEIIGFVDADMATPPESFYDLIVKIGNNDAIVADRYSKGAVITPAFSFRRVVISRIFNFLVRAMFNIRLNDTQCGAKLFKINPLKEVIKDLTTTEWAFDIDILYSFYKRGFKVTSAPTVWYEVKGSKLRIGRASVEMLLAIIRLRIIKSPLKKLLTPIRPIIGKVYRFLKDR